jgi:hypothetical protein
VEESRRRRRTNWKRGRGEIRERKGAVGGREGGRK